MARGHTQPRPWLRRAASESPGSEGDGGESDAVVIMSGVSYDGDDDNTADAAAKADSSGTTAGAMPKVEELKMKLLASVSSLDRGIAAFPSQQKQVDALAAALERSASDGSSPLAPYGATEALQGRWRLVFSSGFGSGSLGGRQPGPPSGAVPFTLGQVYQDIDTPTMRLDNIVELCFRLPSIPFISGDQDPVIAQITLGHSYEVLDGRKITITFDATRVDITTPWPELSSLPSLAVPQLPENLQPPKGLRSASFDVTFVDKDMRVTRGDRGELRVYVRATD